MKGGNTKVRDEPWEPTASSAKFVPPRSEPKSQREGTLGERGKADAGRMQMILQKTKTPKQTRHRKAEGAGDTR